MARLTESKEGRCGRRPGSADDKIRSCLGEPERSLSQSQLQLRMASLTGRSEEAYEAALRQAIEELTEVHQDAFSFV